MASRCVSTISNLNPKIAPETKPRPAFEGQKADIADTHREAMLHIIYLTCTLMLPDMYAPFLPIFDL